MSENIIDADAGYGFILTRFSGGIDRGRCYQINEGGRFVQLTDWQMLQLVAAFVGDHNRETLKANAKLHPRGET